MLLFYCYVIILLLSVHSPKDAVAAIRKRLTGSMKNFHIINLTLTVSIMILSPSPDHTLFCQVLETCVKNCGPMFHSRIATKEFLKDLTNVIQVKVLFLYFCFSFYFLERLFHSPSPSPSPFNRIILLL